MKAKLNYNLAMTYRKSRDFYKSQQLLIASAENQGCHHSEKALNQAERLMDEKRVNTVLKEIIHICLYSGSRHAGIRKSILENCNFMSVLYENPETRAKWIWIEETLTQHEIFFKSFLAAIQPTFTELKDKLDTFYTSHWPGRNYHSYEVMWSKEWCKENDQLDLLNNPSCLQNCYRRIISVCSHLGIRLDGNRKILETIKEADEKRFYSWAKSWLMEFDFFFLDLYEVVKVDLTFFCRTDLLKFRPWPNDVDEYLKVRQFYKSQLDHKDQNCIVLDRQWGTPKDYGGEAKE